METFLSTTVGLLFASFASIISISNPISAMPVFVTLTEGQTGQERKAIARKTAIYMFIILTIFLLAGTAIKNFFGISLAGIRVAGGLIILQSAFTMLKPFKGTEHRSLSEAGKESAKQKDDVSFSPLAMPLLSGPGGISVVIGLASSSNSIMDFVVVIAAIMLSALVAYFALRIAPFSSKYIGPSGMSAVTKMMGFIVMAIAIQFILSGIQDFYGLKIVASG